MNEFSAEDVRLARRPIASLISKSEKAQQKLTPGTWQHAMLRDNLAALYIARTLMAEETSDTVDPSPDSLHEALRALAQMVSRTEKAYGTFSPGTSQHTLLENRLNALHIAETLINAELERRRRDS